MKPIEMIMQGFGPFGGIESAGIRGQARQPSSMGLVTLCLEKPAEAPDR